MSVADIIKAWKDEEYRNQLMSQGIEFPESPVGLIDLGETDLDSVSGGDGRSNTCYTHCNDSICNNTCPREAGGYCS